VHVSQVNVTCCIERLTLSFRFSLVFKWLHWKTCRLQLVKLKILNFGLIFKGSNLIWSLFCWVLNLVDVKGNLFTKFVNHLLYLGWSHVVIGLKVRFYLCICRHRFLHGTHRALPLNCMRRTVSCLAFVPAHWRLLLASCVLVESWHWNIAYSVYKTSFRQTLLMNVSLLELVFKLIEAQVLSLQSIDDLFVVGGQFGLKTLFQVVDCWLALLQSRTSWKFLQNEMHSLLKTFKLGLHWVDPLAIECCPLWVVDEGVQLIFNVWFALRVLSSAGSSFWHRQWELQV